MRSIVLALCLFSAVLGAGVTEALHRWKSPSLSAEELAQAKAAFLRANPAKMPRERVWLRLDDMVSGDHGWIEADDVEVTETLDAYLKKDAIIGHLDRPHYVEVWKLGNSYFARLPRNDRRWAYWQHFRGYKDCVPVAGFVSSDAPEPRLLFGDK